MGDHGRGSLTKLGDGKWRYWPPMRNGVRPPSKTINARTKAEAWQRADEIRSHYATGAAADPPTVTAAIDIWLERHRKLSASSRRNYEQTLRKWTLPELGHIRIDKITVRDLEQHYGQIPTSAAKNAHQVLRQVFKLGLRWGWVTRDIPREAEVPRATGRKLAPPDTATALALFDHYPDERGLFFRLAALTGSRRGELCALRWGDIGDGTITIARTITWGADGKPTVGESTKTGKTRTVSLGADLIRRLEQHRATAVDRPDYYVFTRDDGATPWHPITVSHWFRKAADAVGYSGRLHDLRHYHATALIADGVPVTDVAARLGHAKSTTTLSVYAHALPGRDSAIGDRAERLMGGTSDR